jgi:hypothetical protein
MPEPDPYTIIQRRLAAGEEPTLAEVIDLLRVDAVAAAIFRAGSGTTIAYLIQRICAAADAVPHVSRSHTAQRPLGRRRATR